MSTAEVFSGVFEQNLHSTLLDPSILQITTSWQALALEPGGSSLSTTCMQWENETSLGIFQTPALDEVLLDERFAPLLCLTCKAFHHQLRPSVPTGILSSTHVVQLGPLKGCALCKKRVMRCAGCS